MLPSVLQIKKVAELENSANEICSVVACDQTERQYDARRSWDRGWHKSMYATETKMTAFNVKPDVWSMFLKKKKKKEIRSKHDQQNLIFF